MHRVELKGYIKTDFEGSVVLAQLFNEIDRFTNTTVQIDISELRWIDANLSAMLDSMLYKLRKDNSLTIQIEGKELVADRLNVLFRNGFFNSGVIDDRQSTIPVRSFGTEDYEEFEDYIDRQIFSHRGFENVSDEIKLNIKDDLLEIFQNIDSHARCDKPVFVCGQLYPINKCLVVTICDCGVGFLEPIREFTRNKDEEVLTFCDAIEWALVKENTSLDLVPGGNGLPSVKGYLEESNGYMQIFTGDSFWDSRLGRKNDIIVKQSSNQYFGTTINLCFSTLN